MAHKMPEEICCHVVDDNAYVTEVVLEVKSHERIALFCEGVEVSRKGQLSVIIIGTTTKVYIFDILKLGKEAFNNGLRDILQDKTKEKLMFDCREDSDCLYHQFKVQLSGVLDLQLLEVMYRKTSSAPSSIDGACPSRRSEMVDAIDNVTGFVKCIEVHTKDKDVRKAMDRSWIGYDGKKWLKRPLQQSIEVYCCAKTSAMFTLFENLNGHGENLPRLRVASERYVNLLKDIPQRRFDRLETHTFLPLDIIQLEGTLTFPLANTKCVICQRLFTR
ncbi:piRNA biogenesis protein EXD1-like [Mizuhopecten yessoensis]|uniref:piRNA biogenesis protein EXD1-like n=1 Tax=Mizuhopecten yessoensis TaxID=6573 RepID=UPI000B45CEFD|nr:piRNA biogenesis protein EXD1-like [Mizuhopecten yessoensis]